VIPLNEGHGAGRSEKAAAGTSYHDHLVQVPRPGRRVNFAKEKPPLDKAELKVPPGSTVTAKFSITATFSEPSEYILEVTANDWSGEGGRGFQCCWQRAGEVTVNL
jgi:hypothetical protein